MAQSQPPDKFPAPDGNFTANTKIFLQDHVVWGCIVLVVEGFLLPWPYGVITGIIGAGIAVDTWVHKFFH